MSIKTFLFLIPLIIGELSLHISFAEAETIVHLERQRYRNPVYEKSHETSHQAEEEKPISDLDKDRQENASKYEETHTEKPHKPTSISIHTDGKALEGTSSIDKNSYFRNFTVSGPTLRFQHGEGGDLAKTSSIIFYQSLYGLKSDDEFITITVSRARVATAFGSDTSSTFSVAYDLKFAPHVSKKRLPKIEVHTDTGIKIIDFKKISTFRDNGFDIITGDDSFLERFYYPGCDANLLFENKNGEVLSVPLPAEALEQWHRIGKANLREIKKAYEES